MSELEGGFLGSYVKKLLTSRPKVIRDLLKRYGEHTIKRVEFRRTPLSGITTTLLNFFSRGELDKNLLSKPYDKLYHLSANIYLTDGRIIGLEKNERPNVKYGGFPLTKDTDTIFVGGGNYRLRGLIEMAEDRNKELYRYSGFKNNCQKFLMDVFRPLIKERQRRFILQNVEGLVKDSIKRLSNIVTDVQGIKDYILRGGSLRSDSKIYVVK